MSWNGTRASARLLGRVPRPRVIDQDPPHLMRRDRKELHAVLPADPPLIDELQVDLVDQRGRRQRMVRTLAP